MTTGTRAGTPSRRRGAALDGHLREVTTAMLREVGYRALTIEAVAARAGVAKTSVYRRWPTKAALVGTVLSELALGRPARSATERTTDTPGELFEAGHRLAGLLGQPAMTGAVLGVLLDADDADMPVLRDALMGGRPGGPGGPTSRTAVLGAVFLRSVVMRLPVDDAWLRALLTDLATTTTATTTATTEGGHL